MGSWPGTLVLAAALALGGCAGRQSAPPVRHFDMEPVTIVGDPDGDPALAGPEVAFEVALQRYDAGDRTGALKYYDAVWQTWPGSEATPPAMYNAGLILEDLEDYPAALSRYLTVIDAFPKSDEAYDAHFRAAWCWEKVHRPDKAAELARAVLDHPRLTAEDRLDANLRIGVALFQQGELDRAEALITHALSPLGLARGIDTLDGNSVAAQGQFTLGEIWSARYRAIELHLPKAQMLADLERKCTLLLRAQYSYLRAMKLGDRHWATAAAFGIGQLYDHFIDSVLEAETPAALSPAERAVYRCELKKYVDVLTRKAIMVYSRNVDVAERLGLDNEWVQKADARLRVLQERYLDEYDLCREAVEQAVAAEAADAASGEGTTDEAGAAISPDTAAEDASPAELPAARDAADGTEGDEPATEPAADPEPEPEVASEVDGAAAPDAEAAADETGAPDAEAGAGEPPAPPPEATGTR